MFKRLLATLTLAVVATSVAVPAVAAGPTIVDRAGKINAKTGEFSTLLAAAACTPGIVDALSAKGQRTLFAPTDAAFGALSLDATNVCTAFDTATLSSILLYHVTPGRKPAGWIKNQAELPMANGDTAQVTVSGRDISVDGAKIIKRNVPASNGFIQVVDAVLLPPTE